MLNESSAYGGDGIPLLINGTPMCFGFVSTLGFIFFKHTPTHQPCSLSAVYMYT